MNSMLGTIIGIAISIGLVVSWIKQFGVPDKGEALVALIVGVSLNLFGALVAYFFGKDILAVITFQEIHFTAVIFFVPGNVSICLGLVGIARSLLTVK